MPDGLPPRQPVPDAQRADVARDYLRRYNAGDSLRTIAADTGRSYGFVHTLLIEAGATMRPRGGRRVSGNDRTTQHGADDLSHARRPGQRRAGA